MFDIYKEIDSFIDELIKYNYQTYALKIKEAKLSGTMGTEILGLTLIELKKYRQEILNQEKELTKRAELLIYKIETKINL